MKVNEILDKYLQDPNVLYIYEIGLQIYGIFEDIEDRDFLIVVTDDYDITDLADSNLIFIKVKDWFDCVLNNSLLAWECACLPKKYILKEYVKLLLQTNPLQLRKEFDKENLNLFSNLDSFGENTLTLQKELFKLLKYLIFANQIIENHKIVNYKSVKDYYRKMVDGTIDDKNEIINVYQQLSKDHLKLFKDYTDSVLRASKIKKFLQNEKH